MGFVNGLILVEKLPLIKYTNHIMKIGIDARLLGPEQGGLGRYVQELVLNLEKIINNPADEVVVFLRSANWSSYTPANSRFKKILADVPWYSLAEQITLPKIFKREQLDLLHVPHWNIPIFYRRPFVVTIHDLLLLKYPSRQASTLGPIKYWFKNMAFRLALRHAIYSSQHIFTPSQFTKQDILKNFKINPNKITVTLLAPFSHSPTSLPTYSSTHLLTQFNITKPYALYVGVAYPHKNLTGLIKAWAIVEQEAPQKYQLVIAGKKNYFYNQLLCHCEKAIGRRSNPLVKPRDCRAPLCGARNDSIVYTDFVPDSELPALYQNATLYIHPSFYEGSALPAYEATAYDVAVASSNASCLPELLKDGAAYFDPADVESIASTILRLLADKNERETLIKLGQKNISSLSWHAVAKTTWEGYQNSV